MKSNKIETKISSLENANQKAKSDALNAEKEKNAAKQRAKEDGFFGTAPVNSFRPNDFGLHNTVGNVWEWTNDFWSARWHIPNTDETRKNPAGPQKAAVNRVLKGGSFLCHDSYCYRYRNSARTFNSPNTSTSHIGFRCVKTD